MARIDVVGPDGKDYTLDVAEWSKAKGQGFTLKREASQLESGVRGAVQGASLGWADELAGHARALTQAPGDWLYEKMNPQDTTTSPPYGQLYVAGRDDARSKDANADVSNPWTYGLAEVGGTIIPAALSGVGLPAALAVGATQGVGTSEAENLGDLAKSGALGAGGGALGYGAGKALQVGLSKIPDAARVAQSAAVRSTNADRTATRRAFRGNEPLRQDVGQFLLDNDFPLRSPSGIKERALGIQRNLGNSFRSTVNAADSSGATADLAAAVAAAKANPSIANLAKNTETEKVYQRVAEMLDDQMTRHGGNVSPTVAHDIRMQLDQLAKFDKLQPDAVTGAWKAARGAVDDELTGAMQRAGQGQTWADINSRFRLAKLLSSERPGAAGRGLADIGAERLQGNRFFSPSEKAAAVVGGAASLVSGNPLPMLAPVAAFAANRGTFPAIARASQAASKVPGLAAPAATLAPVGRLAPAAGMAMGAAAAIPSNPVPSPKQLAQQDPVVGEAYQKGGSLSAAATFYSEAQKRPDEILSWLNSGSLP